MIEKLYWKDAYVKEFDATVIGVNGNVISLDRTAFYPTGGGQLNDTGIIVVKGREYKVTDVKKEADEIMHFLESADGITVGDMAHCVIDWERRYSLMKYHTAIHVLSAMLARHQSDVKFTGGMIYVDKAHGDFDCPSLNKELAAMVVQEMQKVISEGHEVTSRFITHEEAIKIPNLIKTQPGEELTKGLEKIRIVEIEGVDLQADGGTHVHNTKELGTVLLKKFDNKGAHRKRIEIVLS